MKNPLSTSKFHRGQLEAMARAAWAVHARENGIDPKDKEAYRAFYVSNLRIATGRGSSTECNRARHFDLAMAHFQGIEGSDFDWLTKAEQADLDRLKWSLRRKVPGYLEAKFGGQRSLAAEVLATARQISGRPDLAGLRQLGDIDLQRVVTAYLIDAQRWMARRNDGILVS